MYKPYFVIRKNLSEIRLDYFSVEPFKYYRGVCLGPVIVYFGLQTMDNRLIVK